MAGPSTATTSSTCSTGSSRWNVPWCPSWRRADLRDPNRLDADRDGIACERNPLPREMTLLIAASGLRRARSVPRAWQPVRQRVFLLLGTGAGLAMFQTAYFGAVQDARLAIGTIVTLGADSPAYTLPVCCQLGVEPQNEE